MSVDELAQALTPVASFGSDGKLYRAIQPAYEVARAALNGQALGAVSNGQAPGSLGVAPAPPPNMLGNPNLAAQPNAAAGLVQPNVNLNLEWYFDPNDPGHAKTTSFTTIQAGYANYPFSTIVYIQFGDGSSCTGTYVGPHQDTLITAAHCVFSNGNWTACPLTFTPAASGFNGTPSSAPYGQFSGCVQRVIPSGWVSNHCPAGFVENDSCEIYDAAIVNFSGNSTIQFTGTMGIEINGSNLPNMWTYGYPAPYTFTTLAGEPEPVTGSQFPACGPSQNPNGLFPLMCGEGDQPSAINSYELESDSWESSPGRSGAPIWQWYQNGGGPVPSGAPPNQWPEVQGIVSGQDFYTDVGKCGFAYCYRNYGIWIDNFIWNFINANSTY